MSLYDLVVVGSLSYLPSILTVACSLGTFYDQETKLCLLCPAGTYQHKEGKSSCTPCPHHRDDVGMEGAKSVDECEGEYMTQY